MDEALRRAERDAALNDAYLPALERLVALGARSHALEARRELARRDLLGILRSWTNLRTRLYYPGTVEYIFVNGLSVEGARIGPWVYFPGCAPIQGDRLLITEDARGGLPHRWAWFARWVPMSDPMISLFGATFS